MVSIVSTARSAPVQHRDERPANYPMTAASSAPKSHVYQASEKYDAPPLQSFELGTPRSLSTTSPGRRNSPTLSSTSARPSTTGIRSHNSFTSNVPSGFLTTMAAPKNFDNATSDAPFFSNDRQSEHAIDSETRRLSTGMVPMLDFSSDFFQRSSELHNEPPSNPNMEASIFSWIGN